MTLLAVALASAVLFVAADQARLDSMLDALLDPCRKLCVALRTRL